MKFYVETRRNGEKIKKKIKKVCEKEYFVTVGKVIEIFGHTPAVGTESKGWYAEDVKKKMRLRETKDGWFLYIPGEVNLGGKEQMPKEEKPPIPLCKELRKVPLLIPCKVISKPTKNSVREEQGYSAPIPFQLDFEKSNDERVAFPVFVVIMKNDGSVRQVKPENIIFELEGDE